MQYIRMLTELDQNDLPLAGGKGANLGALIKAGLPVPPGFCITTRAYLHFVEANRLQDRILELVKSVQPNQLDSLESVSAAIRSLFEAGTMPEAVAGELAAAYAQAAAADGSPAPVAVRSSATTEDLPELSFAGQQDTYLNVLGIDALQQAVIRCWASLWTARAIGYRARSGIDPAEVALAVIVQQMIQSEASGVLFTANPLTGKRSETVIDAAFGLGEALVSGLVEPDHYVVDAKSGCILEKTLGAKALAIRSLPGGGTQTIHADASREQALPDEQILTLSSLGQQAARHFGAPQDLEWAWAGGRLYVLQSRPITSLYPLPEGVLDEPMRVFYSFGAAQGMLDPISPLGIDFFLSLAAGVGRNFGSQLTPKTQTFFMAAGCRAFINITGLFRTKQGRQFLKFFVPAIDPANAALFQQILDDPRLSINQTRASFSGRVKFARGALRIAANVLRNLVSPESGRERINRRIERYLQSIQTRVSQAEDLKTLAGVLQELYILLPQTLLPFLASGAISGIGPLQLLLRLSKQLPDGSHMVMELTRGLPYNVTTEMDLALWDTAQVIQADPESAAEFEKRDAAALAAGYQAGLLPTRAQTAVDRFMQRYGMRGVAEIDIYRPRWRDQPLHIFQVLKSYLSFGEEDLSPAEVFRRGAERAQAAGQQLISAFRRERFGWMKAHLARFLIHRVRKLGGLRETPKFTMVRFLGIVRAEIVRAGEQLAAQGTIGEANDIFFLHLWELQALAEGSLSNPRELISQRRQAYQRELGRKQIPRLILSDGTTLYDGSLRTAQAEAEGNTLTGSPVSAGTVEGVVRVVFDPHQTQLQPGEILVCPGTDPAWTPLFLAAGGLVMETGGMMTHGSVVAREYGIPAVVGVSQATTRLQTGQRIRVDGSSGIITILV